MGNGGEPAGYNSSGVMLSWSNLSVTRQGSGQWDGRQVAKHFLLHKICGFAEPGSILAIMGCSGSGKTTLLNALAGRLGNLTLEEGSKILANGMEQQLSYGNLAYVTQDDSLITTLSVYETLMYSAHLQLPSSMSNYEKQKRVHSSIQEMGLGNCVDTRVGGWHVRGLSGGEKRRLSIAIESLHRPSLFFLDEPTSGLDSAAALQVVKRLRALAKGGRTVIISIHQPSSETFNLFDYLHLLAGGKTVYFGDCSKAQQFYQDAGFPCPLFRNPCDHFLWVINVSFEEMKLQDVEMEGTSESIANGAHNIKILTDAYAASDILKMVQLRIQQATNVKGEKLKAAAESEDFLRKTYYLTVRSFTNMWRDLTYYWLRIFVYVLLALVLGTIYYKVGLGYTAIQARGAMLMFVASFMTFLGVLSFPCFIEDMKIFMRERLNGHYGVASFVVANTLSSFPFLLLTALVPGGLLYILSGLHPGFDRFFYFFVNLLVCLCAVEGMLMAIASIVPDFLSGMMIGSGLMGAYLLTGGFFRLVGDLPKPLWRYPFSYLSFSTWINKAFFNNDFIGLEFENNVPGGHPITGEDVLRTTFQMHISYSKWCLTLILVFMGVVYRLLFFLSTKFRERLPDIISRINNERRRKMSGNGSSGRIANDDQMGQPPTGV